MMMMKLESVATTTVGRRSNNEDALYQAPEQGLFVVADGMGGYAGGELASRLTIEAFGEFFARDAADPDATWPFALDRALSMSENLLDVAIRLAHQRVVAHKIGTNSHMGSTVAALLLRDGQAVIGHVGDSRVYRMRDGKLRQLTRDHSLYEEMLASRTADVPSRQEFAYSNVITRALGMPEARADLRTEPLRAGDLYLLCTDGLTERLEDDEIEATLLETSTLKQACELAVSRALACGTRDNTTAVLVRVQQLAESQQAVAS